LATRRRFLLLCALAAAALAAASCGPTVKAVDETVGPPVRAVESGVGAIGKGVGQVGETVTGGAVGKLFTDRNRFSLRREHRDLSDHLKAVDEFFRSRGVTLDPNERKILQTTRDNLAVTGRQLEADRIRMELGLRIQKTLDDVRHTFDLFRSSRNAPRYTGYIAPR